MPRTTTTTHRQTSAANQSFNRRIWYLYTFACPCITILTHRWDQTIKLSVVWNSFQSIGALYSLMCVHFFFNLWAIYWIIDDIIKSFVRWLQKTLVVDGGWYDNQPFVCREVKNIAIKVVMKTMYCNNQHDLSTITYQS